MYLEIGYHINTEKKINITECIKVLYIGLKK